MQNIIIDTVTPYYNLYVCRICGPEFDNIITQLCVEQFHDIMYLRVFGKKNRAIYGYIYIHSYMCTRPIQYYY